MDYIKITLLTFIIIFFAGCSKKEAPQSNAPKEKASDVRVIVAKETSISNQIKTSGTVGSKVETSVYSTQEGIVERLSVREGDFVKKGSILCYIVSSEHENLLAIARLDYEKVISEEGKKDSEKALSAKKRLDTAKELYKPFPVVCPVNGTVTLKNVENGVSIGMRQPLLTVSDLGSLIVKTALSERYAGDIKKGQKVMLFGSNSAESGFSGVISMVYPVVDVKTRTFGIEITPDNKKALKPGMMVIVQLTTKNTRKRYFCIA
jgi:membrane fusion protein (multidrug efflux system)